ncbi:MAG: hypothetical protein LJE93_03645 [Acidobacteria bacterium]|jgi:hypothetical protein|nr:hypothetical protein [Acidobacteriota bacterium]
MKDVRPWTYAALFGTLWGAIEATLGTVLYLGKLPLRGSIIGIAGLLCLVCLRRLQPKPGVCLLAGVVAVFIKIFTLGGLYPGPVIGIVVQALAVEIALTATGGRAVGAAIGGFFALATNPLQKLTTMWVVTGRDAVRGYMQLLQESATAIGLGGLSPTVIVSAVVVATGAIGAVGGLWAWRVAGRVVQRIGRSP